MKFKLMRASEMEDGLFYSIEIKTLEDLKKIYKKYQKRIIVDFLKKEIIVYDDFMEW